MAERQGFEPWVPAKAHLISNQARSATPAPLLNYSVFTQTFLVCRHGAGQSHGNGIDGQGVADRHFE
jgi:hypothetical protein